MRKRGNIALAVKQKTKYVGHRIPFLPLEVNVRDTSGDVLGVDEQSSDRVGNHGTSCVQDTVVSEASALNLKSLIELRSVGSFNLKENNRSVIGNSMKLPYECLDPVEIFRSYFFRPKGNGSKWLIS